MEIHAKNVLDAWRKSLRYILEEGVDFKDRDNRNCRELLNLVVKIENPEKDSDKPIDLMRQFDWIYPSKEELSAIILNKEESAGYDFSYGPRIFSYASTKDQINDYILPLLKKDSHSRRAVASLFNPLTDSKVLSKNVPSIMFIYFKILDDHLHLTFFIRSNDFFIGWPGNIYQIIVLQKSIAGQLNVKIGTLTTISCSAHIFHEHLDMINRIIR